MRTYSNDVSLPLRALATRVCGRARLAIVFADDVVAAIFSVLLCCCRLSDSGKPENNARAPVSARELPVAQGSRSLLEVYRTIMLSTVLFYNDFRLCSTPAFRRILMSAAANGQYLVAKWPIQARIHSGTITFCVAKALIQR
jgi:hypothetical protein